MGVTDVQVIGVGKDEYSSSLDGMIDGNVLPWVEDLEEQSYPVWDDYDAVQRSTYFLNREGELLYQFNITTLDPNRPEDYNYFINLILDFRANSGSEVILEHDPRASPVVQMASTSTTSGIVASAVPSHWRRVLIRVTLNPFRSMLEANRLLRPSCSSAMRTDGMGRCPSRLT